MSLELIVKPQARLDILDSFDWYEEQREGLGARFLIKVEKGLDAIRDHPTGYQIIDKKVSARRNLLRPFPFMIVYTIEKDRIVVYAVVHAKRHHRVWKRRF